MRKEFQDNKSDPQVRFHGNFALKGTAQLRREIAQSARANFVHRTLVERIVGCNAQVNAVLKQRKLLNPISVSVAVLAIL